MTQTITAAARNTRGMGAIHTILVALVGAGLLALSAQFKVPFYPVPMSLQTLVVLALPVLCGWRGAAAVGAYLAAGAAGLPVFAGGGGVVYLFGPTGGFLAGFFVAAVFVAWFAGQGKVSGVGFVGLLLLLVAADGLIFLCGALWLSSFVGGLEESFKVGVLPFVYGDLLKVAVVAIVAHLWRRRG